MTDIERFLSKFKVGDECWLWHGGTSDGYGKLKGYDEKVVSAHRFSYKLFNGDIPEGKFVCHSCDSRNCVKPTHLWIGTHSDNMKDAYAKGRIKNPNPFSKKQATV